MPRPEHDRWQDRRLLGLLLETVVVLGPAAVGSAVVWAGSVRTDGWSLLPRLALLLVLSCAAAAVAERLLRRLAPLGTLLRLTLVFPESAPSRLSVAKLAGHPEVLRARLASDDQSEAEAAQTVLALVARLTRHDSRTRGHSERTRLYTDLISEHLGLPQRDRDRLRWAALLHDIGKLDVDALLLNKAGRPSDAEWDSLRAHPARGARIAAPLLPWLGEWGRAIGEHHERYDGSGYPAGLAGEDISRAARIVAVADSFETMTAARSYKRPMNHREARTELARCAGTQFDPLVVRAFLELSLPRSLRVLGPVAALVQLPFAGSLQWAGGRVAEVSVAAAVVGTPLLSALGAPPPELTVVAQPPAVVAMAPDVLAPYGIGPANGLPLGPPTGVVARPATAAQPPAPAAAEPVAPAPRRAAAQPVVAPPPPAAAPPVQRPAPGPAKDQPEDDDEPEPVGKGDEDERPDEDGGDGGDGGEKGKDDDAALKQTAKALLKAAEKPKDEAEPEPAVAPEPAELLGESDAAEESEPAETD